jgi:Lrp/AsnC family transcriptional regulator for asnA, asnC and gidA
VRLDSIDRQLIACLKLDGRMSYAEMASRLKVSEGTAKNRLSRLLESGALRVFPVVEPEPIGYRLNVWLGIQCEPGALQKVGEALRQFHAVRYVGLCAGAFDIICEAVFLSARELLSFLSDEVSAIDGVVDMSTSTVLDTCKLGYEWELREEDVGPARRRSKPKEAGLKAVSGKRRAISGSDPA